MPEPFIKIEKSFPHLVNLDHKGCPTENSRKIDLFEREAYESRQMTKGSEVVEGFWVGNDCDVPGGADDGVGARMSFDVCVRVSLPKPYVLANKIRRQRCAKCHTPAS